MNTLNSSLQCDVVRVLEERIWLDRREDGCRVAARKAVGIGRLLQPLRDLRARMQLGPVEDGDGWASGEPGKRF